MNRIQTIVDKEWAEVFKNRVVLLTVIIMPLVFTILPLVVLNTLRTSGGVPGNSSDMPSSFAKACTQGMSAGDCMQIFLVNEFLLLFMMMPLAIPIAIAAYSIVGEKATHSLEPLLATPITTVELLVGKAFAAGAPAIVTTWVCFIIFVLATQLVGVTPAVRAYILGPTWLLAVLLVGPLMAIAAVNFALIVSSRVSDPRAAEQISMVLILPLLAALFGQIAGVLVINVQFMLLAVVFMAVADVGLIYLGASLFQRETILTKWK